MQAIIEPGPHPKLTVRRRRSPNCTFKVMATITNHDFRIAIGPWTIAPEMDFGNANALCCKSSMRMISATPTI
jgi:hypothetical protein